MKKLLFILFALVLFLSLSEKVLATEIIDFNNVLANNKDFDVNIPDFTPGFGEDRQSCQELLGSSVVTLVKAIRITIQGLGAGIAIANSMMTFVPAIMGKDADALNKAFKKFVQLLIILALLLLMPTLLRVLGDLCGFDLSCI